MEDATTQLIREAVYGLWEPAKKRVAERYPQGLVAKMGKYEMLDIDAADEGVLRAIQRKDLEAARWEIAIWEQSWHQLIDKHTEKQRECIAC